MSNGTAFIDDEDVEKALDWLRDNAVLMGTVTMRARLTEHMTKHVVALEMKRHDGSAAAQEREARASQAYVDAITAEAMAAGDLAEARALREAAALKVEAWRSQQANIRMMKI